ncbi:hypothetical protein BJ170DRAFT_596791 [Xylariales sp. AK1849]|nr:hypothetical protein BJ170DRAFT_596791 [Xylariales sp. AK1849]
MVSSLRVSSHLPLDSGDSRVMLVTERSVKRRCNHKWKHLSETKSGRVLFVLLDIVPLYVNGQLIDGDLGEVYGDYALHPEQSLFRRVSCCAYQYPAYKWPSELGDSLQGRSFRQKPTCFAKENAAAKPLDRAFDS